MMEHGEGAGREPGLVLPNPISSRSLQRAASALPTHILYHCAGPRLQDKYIKSEAQTALIVGIDILAGRVSGAPCTARAPHCSSAHASCALLSAPLIAPEPMR